MTIEDQLFNAKLKQIKKQNLAEMTRITTYWLATRPATFPYSLPEKQDSDDGEFSLEEAVLRTIAGVLDILEIDLPRDFQRTGEAYLILQRYPPNTPVLAAWSKNPLSVEDRVFVSGNLAEDMYIASGANGGGIENGGVRIALTEVLTDYLFDKGLNLADNYSTAIRVKDIVILKWQLQSIE